MPPAVRQRDGRADPAGRRVPAATTGARSAATSTAAGDPVLRGWYVFSDYCTGTLFGVCPDADGVVGPRTLLETGFSASTFGEGPDGEVYVADLAGGRIYRLVAGD